MASSAVKRLRQELKSLSRNDPDLSLSPDENDIRRWKAVLKGPGGTPYAGGEYHLTIVAGSEYPLTPPTMTFETRIFHPNIHFATGEICLDILKTQWTPAWSIESACRAVVAMMCEPIADSPLNCDAGNMLRGGDERGFKSLARMYAVEYANAPSL